MDYHHPPLHTVCMDLPLHWSDPRWALGIRCAWLGRLLGLGSDRECNANALADRNGLPAFGDDDRKAWHDEKVEHGADHSHLFAFTLWYIHHTHRCDQFCPCVFQIRPWPGFLRFHWAHIPWLSDYSLPALGHTK